MLDLIHFALRPDGFMMLGTSESIDETSRHCSSSSTSRTGFYRAQMRSRTKPLASMLPAVVTHAIPSTAASPVRRHDAYGEIHQSLLESYAPPSVVVDDHHAIVHLSESAGQFLRFTAGEPTLGLVNAVHPALRLDVRAALHQAFQTMKRVEARHVELKRPTGTSFVDITVQPVRDVPTSRTFALVIFDEVYAADGGDATADQATRRAGGLQSRKASSRARASSFARRSSSTRRRTRS